MGKNEEGGTAIDTTKAGCIDCGLLYDEFPIDTTLPDNQWLMIHPEGRGGLLCANCIVKRASRLLGIIAVRMIFEIRGEVQSMETTSDVIIHLCDNVIPNITGETQERVFDAIYALKVILSKDKEKK